MYRSHDSDRDSPHEVGYRPRGNMRPDAPRSPTRVALTRVSRAAPQWPRCAAPCCADAAGRGSAPRRAASPPAARASLRSCCQRLVGVRQLVGDDERRRAAAAAPRRPGRSLRANSPTLASTYCARRRMRGSCPSAQLERNVAAIDLDDDLAHLTPPVRAAGRAWRARRRRAQRSRPRPRATARSSASARPRRGVSARPRRRWRTPPRAAPRARSQTAPSASSQPAHLQARRRSAHPLVFLQRADIGRARRVREELRPLRPRHLADIEVAARIDA